MYTPREPGKSFWSIQDGCIDCGDGWYNLIDTLSGKLELMIRADDWDFACGLPRTKILPYVVQIKEKFGQLRFYLNEYPDDVYWDVVSNAEHDSLRICEECGDTDGQKTSTQTGWIKTLCGTCNLKYQKAP